VLFFFISKLADVFFALVQRLTSWVLETKIFALFYHLIMPLWLLLVVFF